MKKLLKSKAVAAILLILVVVSIICSFKVRTAPWMFIDVFFLFMAAFTHLMALIISKFSIPSSKTLENIALVCGILFVLAFIGEYIAFQILF